MRLLLDSHTVFWWLLERSRLSKNALATITAESNEIFVSIASAWEMAIKVGTGKWPEARSLIENFEKEIELSEFRLLPITVIHVRAAGLMKSPHRDPFDRMLAAQALAEGLSLVTADAKLAQLGAAVVW